MDIVSKWSVVTGLHADMKKCEYLYMLSNNDYISDSLSKGFFSQNTNNGHRGVPNIITKAVVDNLLHDTPTITTVENGKDIRDYLSYIKSNDTLEWYGCIFNNARFYYSNGQKLCKIKNDLFGKTTLVPVTTNGVTIADDLDVFHGEMPDDIDYRYYVTEANKIIEKLKFTQLNLF